MSAQEDVGEPFAGSVDDAFAASVVAGLSATPKTLECKYLYDPAGSRLFDRICELPEYYPTRTETQILAAHTHDIASLAGTGAELIELGSGFGRKTHILLSSMHAPVLYRPVDIAGSAVHSASQVLRDRYPGLRVEPLVADFSARMNLPQVQAGARRLLFFAGSTIGNFTLPQAQSFLRGVRHDVRPDAFIIGVDLVKDERTLLLAYDDAAGVTAAFNLNLLTRMNREIGGNFDRGAFRHEARWNREAHRVEMHIVSLREQVVRVASRQFAFARDESIHTENSHKYSLTAFVQLARAAGWQPLQVWTDPAELFSVHVLVP